jgi:hypothetical protein
MLIITGSGFSSEKAKVKVFFGETPGRVFVSSPVSIGVEVPRGQGECPLTVEVEGRRSSPAQFNIGEASGEKPASAGVRVSMEVSDPVADVGKTITGTFRVTGTERPVRIRFRNESPEVVSVDGGNEQSVVTRGGADNVYTFPIRAITGPRRYSFSFAWENYETEKTSHKKIWERVDLTLKQSQAK